MSEPTLARRGVLFGAGCLLGCGSAAPGRVACAAAAPLPAACSDLAAPPAVALAPEEAERHGIFMLLAMALVHDGWGVDRQRPERVAAYAAVAPTRQFADYLGHNIGALLVDRESRIVCFALNRSVALNSTLEHAEARSIRAAIQIANAARKPNEPPSWSFGSLLQADRLYTTLEPCTQCAGILDIAAIGDVIFAQDDPGQHHITDVLYNLRREPGSPSAPVPIRASFLPVWVELAAAYRRFAAAASPDGRRGMTSFLETVEAYLVFQSAAAAFATMQEQHAVNAEILRDALTFRARWRDRIQSGLVPS